MIGSRPGEPLHRVGIERDPRGHRARAVRSQGHHDPRVDLAPGEQHHREEQQAPARRTGVTESPAGRLRDASSGWTGLLGRAASGELHRGRLDGLDGTEHDVFAFGVDHDRVAGVEFLPQDLLGQRVFDEPLDRTPERPGAQ